MYGIIFNMSTLVFSHINALRALRRERRIHSAVAWDTLSAADARLALDTCIPNKSQLDMAYFDRLGLVDESDFRPPHLLVASPASRRPSKPRSVIAHVHTGNLPRGAIQCIEHDLYTVSPAFAALQYSLDHSYEATFMLLMELLGTYTLPEEATFPIADGEPWNPEDQTSSASNKNARSDDTDGQPETQDSQRAVPVEQVRYGCEPATTIADLQTLSAWARSSKYASFRKAVRHVKAGSASPMESIMYGILGLPLSHGGFACNSLPGGGMLLNKRIVFNSQAVTMASGIPYATCDAYIPAAKTALEYNGEYHETARATLHDAKRNNGLRGMGVSVIVVTREQLYDIPALEAIAMSIYRAAGKRFRYRFDGYRERQQNLLNGLRMGTGLPLV